MSGKFLLFGASGQVGRALARNPNAIPLFRVDVDLRNASDIQAAIKKHKVAAVVNAAAYTDVERAEDEKAECHKINTLAPKAMAATCDELNIPLVHISSEFVFDGSKNGAYVEADSCNPLSVYGSSKFAGEIAVKAESQHYAILRTSWVFSEGDGNFVGKMLAASKVRNALTIVDDQIGAPTEASDIAAAIEAMLPDLIQNPEKSGLYHFASRDPISRFEFAKEIFQMAGRDVTLTPCKSEEFKTNAKRPKNSRLNCDAIYAQFGISQPDWRASLARVLKQRDG